MKSMWPPLVAIFFMTYFHRTGGGGMAPSASPLDPLLDLDLVIHKRMLFCLVSRVLNNYFITIWHFFQVFEGDYFIA